MCAGLHCCGMTYLPPERCFMMVKRNTLQLCVLLYTAMVFVVPEFLIMLEDNYQLTLTAR